MEDKTFELLEKMYGELIGFKNDVNKRFDGVDKRFDVIEDKVDNMQIDINNLSMKTCNNNRIIE